MEIITNNHWHDFILGHQLPANQRKEFDWLSDDEYEWTDFIKYRSEYYALEEFTRAPDGMDYDGFLSDTFFSGIAIRVSDDCDQYQVALILS